MPITEKIAGPRQKFPHPVGTVRPCTAKRTENLADDVRASILTRLQRIERELGMDIAVLLPGKMLRTRLAGRFAERRVAQVSRKALVSICAATELAHTASLCHDDVIDDSQFRRHRPALWTATGRSAAVLTGDVLLCEALKTVADVGDVRLLTSFISGIRELAEAEIRQELAYRGRIVDTRTCMEIAREKTGPLFAFVARACAGDDEKLRPAMEQAGYLIGAAYQLADDLIDVTGREEISGKALGTDAARNKFTLAQKDADGRTVIRTITRLLDEALDALRPWRPARDGLASFIDRDVLPSIVRQGVVLAKEHFR